MSKFSDFIAEKKLDARRILIASSKLEKLRPEDRALILSARKNKGKKKSDDEGEAPKRRSGRPLTNRAMEAALAGNAISGPQKTRFLRAVNHLLEQKSQDKVEFKALF